jgi:L-lactate dehydrogenase complex protein LldG
MPSALTWIGGPSRTGDLEMITTLGVHGPRAVEIVLIG